MPNELMSTWIYVLFWSIIEPVFYLAPVFSDVFNFDADSEQRNEFEKQKAEVNYKKNHTK